MLTIKQITENTEAVIRGLEKKHFKNAKETIEQVIALNDKRRSTQNQLDKNQRPKRFKATISIPLWTWDRKLVEFFQKNKGTTKLYGTECNNIRFKCKLNGRTFTFKAANILETGIDLEVEQKYLNKTTGLPNEKDIASLAEELTTDLLRQENVIQD